MRKLIASVFLSLDGMVSSQNGDVGWVINSFNDQMGKYAGDLMESMDTILLGRVTYEIMTRHWPFQTEETSPGAEKMNSTPKVVFSRTLKKAEWGTYDNATLVKDKAAEEIVRLKAQPGKNMVIYGSAKLVQGLTELKLIDEYQLLVHPVLLGQGKPLFGGQAANLKLLRAETFTNNVVVLYYKVG